MKTMYLLMVIIFISTFSGKGQVIEVNTIAELEYISLTNTSFPVVDNFTQIQQIGNNNRVDVIQQFEVNSTNAATILQNGRNNIAYLMQTEGSHKSHIDQSGSGNTASLWSKYGEIQNSIVQNGNRNKINSYIENYGDDLKSIISAQNGNGNKIDVALLNGDGSNNISDLVLTQKGSRNVMELILDHYDTPHIEVTQTGNNAPRVIIRHSDFSFPLK